MKPDNLISRMPPELPATAAEHLEHRQLKKERTLNDQVEELHLILVENPQYRAYLRAVVDPQAVEGSLSTDNVMAAMMIRDRAKKVDSEVKDEKLATIILSLGVVLRRYGFSRKQRRNELGGKIVPQDNED